MTSLAITAAHLRKEYGEKVAVQELTLEVKRGEVFGFLGPNGAGKTTSMKMLLGLVTPTSGTGQLLGLPIGTAASRERVGFLPEHFRFHEWLTAGEFLDFHGRLYGLPRPERQKRIPELLELVGLGTRFHTRLGAFSKGMMQRIGIAQALLNDPQLIFLDEPTSGLDPIGRRLVRDIILNLRSEGTTVFLNSHLLSEVEQTCDRVSFIKNGRIEEVSDISALGQSSYLVTIRVGQPTEKLCQELAQFGNKVKLVDGRVLMEVLSEETLPKITQWLAQQGQTLYEFSPRHISLEERYLQVVGEETGDR